MSVFEWPVRVYIEDTDAGGIVYYVNYLKFMERARTEYLRSLGFGKEYIFNQQLMFVVHSLNCDYLKPAQLDDELLVTADIIEQGKSYMLMEQCVYRFAMVNGAVTTEERELLCKGAVKIACVESSTVKPRRIPQELLLALSQ
jgi:tol-pal system-associated acyl-CoA thioesterase